MENEAIIATIMDYFEGWFDGDPVRMERALHDDLVKRGIKPDGSLNPITAAQMNQGTREGYGKKDRPADLAIKATVNDVYNDIASVTVHSAVFIEYVHLLKTANGWRIVNTLYRRRT